MLSPPLAAPQQITAGHVLDGGEVGRRVRARYAALVVAEHHVSITQCSPTPQWLRTAWPICLASPGSELK